MSSSGCSFLDAMESAMKWIEVGRDVVLAGDFNVHFNTEQRKVALLCDLFEGYGLKKRWVTPA